jgi:hypothetical protein
MGRSGSRTAGHKTPLNPVARRRFRQEQQAELADAIAAGLVADHCEYRNCTEPAAVLGYVREGDLELHLGLCKGHGRKSDYYHRNPMKTFEDASVWRDADGFYGLHWTYLAPGGSFGGPDFPPEKLALARQIIAARVGLTYEQWEADLRAERAAEAERERAEVSRDYDQTEAGRDRPWATLSRDEQDKLVKQERDRWRDDYHNPNNDWVLRGSRND